MNREIKFRAWHVARKKMFDDILGSGYETKRALMGLELHEYLRMVGGAFQDYIPMQFTGLTDKNGKEIYEEDVVRIQTTLGPSGPELKYRNTEVKWDNHRWSPFHYSLPERMEVIGNIYENPELIEKSV